MQKYSEFFQTLHDEQSPTGTLGRGTHYSILRAVVFQDADGKTLSEGQFCDFAVIWDEDHDIRILEVIENIYFAGLLSRFLIFGEEKGVLTAIFAGGRKDETQHNWLSKRLNDITADVDNDSWPALPMELGSRDNKIISAKPEKIKLYLDNLIMLWELGLKSADRPKARPPLQLLTA
jgi:hypothetical protein